MAAENAYGDKLNFSRVGQGSTVTGSQYEAEMLYLAQANMPLFQFARTGYDPDKKQGETLVLTIAGNVTTAGGQLTEGTPIPNTGFPLNQIGIKLNEYGNQIIYGGAWDQVFSYTDNGIAIRTALSNDYAKTINTAILTTINQCATALTSPADGSYSFGSGIPASNAVTGSMALTPGMVQEMYDELVKNNTPKIIGPNSDYVWVAHPRTLRSLKRGSAWENANLYAGPRGQDSNVLFSGEAGRYAGFRFVESTTLTNSTAVNGGTSFAFGADAYGVGVGLPMEMRVEPDKFQDYQRTHGVAWYGIYGFALIFGGATAGIPPRIFRCYTKDV